MIVFHHYTVHITCTQVQLSSILLHKCCPWVLYRRPKLIVNTDNYYYRLSNASSHYLVLRQLEVLPERQCWHIGIFRYIQLSDKKTSDLNEKTNKTALKVYILVNIQRVHHNTSIWSSQPPNPTNDLLHANGHTDDQVLQERALIWPLQPHLQAGAGGAERDFSPLQLNCSPLVIVFEVFLSLVLYHFHPATCWESAQDLLLCKQLPSRKFLSYTVTIKHRHIQQFTILLPQN